MLGVGFMYWSLGFWVLGGGSGGLWKPLRPWRSGRSCQEAEWA